MLALAINKHSKPEPITPTHNPIKKPQRTQCGEVFVGVSHENQRR